MDKTPSEKRSESLNPTSQAYKAAVDNRSNQLNPNNLRYSGNQQKSKR